MVKRREKKRRESERERRKRKYGKQTHIEKWMVREKHTGGHAARERQSERKRSRETLANTDTQRVTHTQKHIYKETCREAERG